MYRGNFDIGDRLDERVGLRYADVEDGRAVLATRAGAPGMPRLAIEDDALQIEIDNARCNRFWLRIVAEADEQLWGAVEQMSYFGLRGRTFPLWTSERGVGRDKTSPITFQADVTSHAGGDYWNTNYPQPTWLSSRPSASPI